MCSFFNSLANNIKLFYFILIRSDQKNIFEKSLCVGANHETDHGRTPLLAMKRAEKMVLNGEATIHEAALHHQFPCHVTLSRLII